MELNEMIMVMGTPAQAASRITGRRPRLSRGPSSMWGRAAIPELPPGCVQLPYNQPCPIGWVDKTPPGPEPVRICCPAPGQPLAGPCPEGYKLVPPYYDAWGNPKCEKKGDRPLAVPTDTRGRNAHLSRYFPGRQLAQNPVDSSRESALVRTSSPYMKTNPEPRRRRRRKSLFARLFGVR